MKLFDMKKNMGFVAGLLLLSAGLFAQEKNDVIKVFNEGVEFMKANDPRAIQSFETCIQLCEQMGDSANDIKAKAAKVLPDLYFQKAFDFLTVEKNIPEALRASKQTLAVARKYGDTKTLENTQKIMIQAYSSMASGYVSSKDNVSALMAYDSVLALSPDHLPSIYNKALLYKAMDNRSQFGETIDLYLEKMNATGDTIKVQQAGKVARDFYRIAGSKANQANKLTDALTLLNTASKYGADKSLYYQYANVYNKQKKFALAIENAQKGLNLETGTPEDKAKYYFEMAEALFNQGKTAEACEAYKNAMYGPFLIPAKTQRTNLKCQ
jgi:tetratricopeptide (TPR) repeat protein